VTQIELLPCPWCGTVPVGCEHRDVTGEGYYGVECRQCQDVFCGAHGDDVATVHAAWNTRTATPTRSDTREQAAASPSAVGEVTDAMTYAGLLALRDVGYHDETIDTEHMKIAIAAALSSQAPKPASAGGELDAIELHPATKMLVHNFALALAAKLAAAEKKYGYGDNWARLDWADECREHLREHVEKGDPRDVAAYCAFLWFHGERTAIAAEADTATKGEPWVCPAGFCERHGVIHV
jgi:hypothetical protein